MTVRTRFAPSPTGFVHVGNVRTGFFAYLVAKHYGGQFILRLEDTDKNREVAGSADHIKESLRTLGINWDEGLDVGGSYGPYVQSERLEIYREWAQRLIDQGRAYADPYSPEELQGFRDEAIRNKQPFLYRNHRPASPPDWDGSTALRFKSIPRSYTYHDEVFGDVTTSAEVVDDFILMKSDGYPTYNFAHIIDDMLMEITHVIRGKEFMSSMPNYLALYEALGFDMGQQEGSDLTAVALPSKHPLPDSASINTRDESRAKLPAKSKIDKESGGVIDSHPSLPVFAHMPHIMNEQGNKKLGKRDGAKDVLDYIKDGYLPETLDSFIASLGWNDGTEQETFTMSELIAKFSLDRIQRSGARFDEKRLLWMNGQFIRNLSLDDLYTRVTNFWPASAKSATEDYKRQVLALAQDRLKTLRDLPALTRYFFEDPTPDISLISENKQLKKLSTEELGELLTASYDALAAIAEEEWTSENIQNTLNKLLETTGQKPGVLFSMIRIATTWAPFSPQLNDTLALLGQETTILRIQGTIDSTEELPLSDKK